MESKDEKKPASPVSRSVYQKLAEENKRLKADIYSIVTMSKGWMAVHDRWKKKFDDDKAPNDELRELLGIKKKTTNHE